MFENKKIPSFLPVYILRPSDTDATSVVIADEFDSLISTFGGTIASRSFQKLSTPHNATYIGRGKIEEIAKLVHEHDIDIVAIDAMLKPGQLHMIKTILEQENASIEIWDRVELILRIFEKNAHTQNAKLQIDLARMNYMGPRIYGMGYILSRQGGGIGTSGIGETNTELMKRHWRNEKKKIMDELTKISQNKQQQMDRRRESGFKTISIVGYTNAGKSTLFNRLSKKQNLSKDELFATLDSTVGKLYLPEIQTEVLVSDTIGFIRKLPPLLVSAFKSTLMESVHADMLLHVIDVSDPEWSTKIQVVQDILHELEIQDANIIFVFNKTDLAPNINQQEIASLYENFSPIFISVIKDTGIHELISTISKKMETA